IDGVWQKNQLPRAHANIRASELKINSITFSFGDRSPRYRGEQVPVFNDRASAENAKSRAISSWKSNPPTSRGTRYVVTEADFDPGVACGNAQPPKEAEAPPPQAAPSRPRNVGGIILAAPPSE